MFLEICGLCVVILIFLISIPFLYLRFIYIPQVQFEKDADIIVVGAGVFGCAFAYAMGQFGYKIIIIEKDVNNETKKMLGEFLQPGGIMALEKLGLSDCVDGFLEVKGYILHHNDSGSLVDVTYLNSKKTPINGVTFHYYQFINALRNKVLQLGNVQIIPGTVTKLIKEKGVVIGVEYDHVGQTKTLNASLNVLCDGSMSKLKSQILKKCNEIKFSYFIGCILEDCPQTTEGYADIVLTESTPILIYKIGVNQTRLLVDTSSVPANIQNFIHQKILPDIPENMKDSVEDALQNSDMMVMPCRSTADPFPLIPGFLHAGDSFNTRHPLTGGGFTVSLYDAILLTKRLKNVDFDDYRSVLLALRTFGLERAFNHSFVVNVMSFALHQIFAPADNTTRHLRTACIAYLKKRGECLTGPTSLLAVSVSSPFVFLYHFVCVANHSVYLTLHSHRLVHLHKILRDIYLNLSKGFKILIPLVWNDVRSILHL